MDNHGYVTRCVTVQDSEGRDVFRENRVCLWTSRPGLFTTDFGVPVTVRDGETFSVDYPDPGIRRYGLPMVDLSTFTISPGWEEFYDTKMGAPHVRDQSTDSA